MRFKNLTQWLSWLETSSVERNAFDSHKTLRKAANRLNLLSFSGKVVTVAGTNGKGSCAALLESIYSAAGYRVGTFTSPHLLRFNERIRIQQQEVDDAAICAVLAQIDCIREDVFLSYFQFSFLAALLLFQAAKLDLVILEVGIGGQWDAVNIIEPDLSIITSIDLDHCEILGNTRALIAADKAGVMRKDKPAICGDTNSPESFYQKANKIGAVLYCQGRDFYYSSNDCHWTWCSKLKTLKQLPIPSMLLSNAATVLMAIACFQQTFKVSDQAICDGLCQVNLKGRGQIVSVGNLTVLLDVAHNPAAANVLLNKVQSLSLSGRKYAIVGMLNNKDIQGTLSAVSSIIDHWFITAIDSVRSAQQEQLETILKAIGVKKPIQYFARPQLAFQQACQEANPNDLVIVFGSFLTVSDVMQCLFR